MSDESPSEKKPAPRTRKNVAAALRAIERPESLDDLAALGATQNQLNEAEARIPESCQTDELSSLFDTLRPLINDIIFDECADRDAAMDLLYTTIESLADAFAECEPFEIAVVVTQRLGFLRKEPEDMAMPPQPKLYGPDDSGGEAGSFCELIKIQSKEDLLIYTEFIAESGEHLESIESRALELEQSGSEELVHEMFRCFHSMKGAAGFLGLTQMNMLCHEVETLLDRARKHTLVIDSAVVDIVLASIDAAKSLLGILQLRLDQSQGLASAEAPVPGVDLRPILTNITMVMDRPAEIATGSGEVAAEPGKLGGILVENGHVTPGQVEQALEQQKRPLGQVLVDMGATTSQTVEAALKQQQAGGRAGSASIKVDTEKLDSLMEMVGELVIAESQVEQDEALQQEGNLKLARNVNNLSKITRNLQELVMAMRLVPLRQTFQKMVRLVRDTAKKTNKTARLEISGEDTEIDKTVIEEIADPLVHLLRNAVDHGIEAPEERTQHGKPEEGVIRLTAYHEGGNVVIEIGDDGQGINREKVIAKARERGILTEDEVPTEQEIYQLIFAPGFSTHAVATDISGRGVGMDVVKRNIERLGGRVDIQSRVGAGSTFFVRLPLTMAIVDGMVVRVGEERYILPTQGIEESLRPTKEMVSTVAGRGEMILVRGALVPLVRLHGLFAVTSERVDPTEALVILIEYEHRRCGVLVDELIGQQQVVIKSLGSRLKGVQGVSGACILGDGRVGLILDLAGLLTLSEER